MNRTGDEELDLTIVNHLLSIRREIRQAGQVKTDQKQIKRKMNLFAMYNYEKENKHESA